MTHSPIRALLDAPIRSGSVAWIGLRPGRRAEMRVVSTATLSPADGLLGDRYAGSSGQRHVSLIAHESLAAIAAYLCRPDLPPELLRRNVVTAGINLVALKDCRFRLGAALLETTGECHPCSRMEEILGAGGYNAVRGHGGIIARVLEPGTVSIGEAITRIGRSAAADASAQR